MRKGLNALEIIFSLFVLIIVVLVIIRMFTQNVKVDPIITEMNELNKREDFKKAETSCRTICSDYQLSSCDISKAQKFCTQKVSVDMDNNNEPGETSTASGQHGAIIGAVPFCEDGFYCFNIYEGCKCGNVKLDPDTCDALMCEYYISSRKLTEEQAKGLIRNEVNTGSCEIFTLQLEEFANTSIDRDTIMGSGKNWFDIFGMGDCEKSLTGNPPERFSLSLGSCQVIPDAERKSADFTCQVLAKTGSCTSDQVVTVTDEGDKALVAMTGDTSIGIISMNSTTLSGKMSSTEGVAVGTTCGNFVYLCGDVTALPTSCSFTA